jgi:hypothetical protein
MLSFHSKDMFQLHAVAFLDVLGFKELIRIAEKDASRRDPFFNIYTMLDSHARFDNAEVDASVPDGVKPFYIFISDSIIISVPLTYPKPGGGVAYDGLGIVVAKSIQIAHKALLSGFLLRGGISVGPVWQADRNIYGSGYMDAYLAETRANDPKLLLTPVAKEHWEKAPFLSQTTMCIADKGDLIADTLHPDYVPDTHIHGQLDRDFMQYRAQITSRLNSLPVGSSPWIKWWWMADAYNKAIKRHGVDVKVIDREWTFG